MGTSKKVIGLLAVGAATVSMSTVAFAAKGGNGGGGKTAEITIVVSDGVYAGTTDAVVAAGDQARVASNATEEYRTLAQCWQNGELVMMDYSVTENGIVTVRLGPTQRWTGGEADCEISTGDFGKNGRWRSSATTAFHTYDG